MRQKGMVTPETQAMVIVPATERLELTRPLSFRMPAAMLRRVDQVAKATGNTRSDVLLYLLRWALVAYDKREKKS